MPIVGKSTTKPSDDEWSFKCHGTGQRYTFVVDGNGVPMKVWGGYSPKTYDGKFAVIMKYWFLKHLNNCYLLGDCHYWSAQGKMKGVKLRASMPKTVKPVNGMVKIGRETVKATSLSFQEEQKDLKDLRGNVERPFAQITSLIKALSKIFQEDEYQ